MTLFVGCLLIYHLGLPWWCYVVAAVLWGCETVAKIAFWAR